MKLKFFTALLSVLCLVNFTGCVRTADGHHSAGIPLSKDKITSRYQRTVDQIIAASRVVLKRNGKIQNDDTATHSITSMVNTRTVWVRVTPVDEKVSEIVVQVRTKGGVGDIYLASELSKQIALELANQ